MKKIGTTAGIVWILGVGHDGTREVEHHDVDSGPRGPRRGEFLLLTRRLHQAVANDEFIGLEFVRRKRGGACDDRGQGSEQAKHSDHLRRYS